MMKFVYLALGIAIYCKMLVLPNVTDTLDWDIVDRLMNETGIPNTVSGIIFRNRIYDTCFEVVVFTLSIMGVKFLLADEQPASVLYQFTDHPSIVLARLGATIAALVSIELAIRGHLSPGGGFAAGVAGGTAIGLLAITSSSAWMATVYRKWKTATLEKVSVVIFLLVAVCNLIGWELPQGEMGALVSGGWISVLNILVAVKVSLGSWAAIFMFIHYRGLL